MNLGVGTPFKQPYFNWLIETSLFRRHWLPPIQGAVWRDRSSGPQNPQNVIILCRLLGRVSPRTPASLQLLSPILDLISAPVGTDATDVNSGAL